MNKKVFYFSKTFFFLLVSIFFIVINIYQPSNWLKFLWSFYFWFPITTYVVFWEGRNYLKIYKLMMKKIINMNTLIGLGAHVIYLFSILNFALNFNEPLYSYEQIWEGTIILIIMTNLGHYIEKKIRNSTSNFYKKIEEYTNKKTIIVEKNKEFQALAKKVKKGQIIRVNKGQMVPLDGNLLENGLFDYSNITGESNKITILKNQNVLSGSFNIGSSLKIKVTKNFQSSNINKIIEAIEKTIITKPKMQKVADKILRFFIPGVLIISSLAFVVWLILGFLHTPLPWIQSGNIYINALKASVAILAISCPCALGIATPLIYLVSSSHLVKNGILVNEPKALETILEAKHIAFDKTGTLTSEKMKVVEILGDKKYISLAKGLEKNSSHLIGKAIMKIKGDLEKVENVVELQKGIKGTWNNKQVEIQKEENSKQPLTIVNLFINKQKVLTLKLESKLKDNAKKVINKLIKNKLIPLIITGDNSQVANYVGKSLDIKNIFANALPKEKSVIIKNFQKKGKVIFVGDGFNDAISMKVSDISISFSSGNEITNYLSDFSIANSNFNSLAKLFAISKANKKRIFWSLVYAFTFNIVFIPMAFLLLIQPWMAALIMALSNIFVALNGLIYRISGNNKLKKIV